MEWVETTLGGLPVWGDFNSDRPLVLAIRGAFTAPRHLWDLDPPGADLGLVHLPGFFTPALSVTSIPAFASAFDEAVLQLFSRRDVFVVGVSTGALVALAMRAPQIRAVLAVEPYFSTAKLWPLHEFLRRVLAKMKPDDPLREWIRLVLGVTPTSVEDCNYEGVLVGAPPAMALVGDVPLYPVRPLWELPSLTDEDDRLRLPCERYSGGHEAPISAIRDALVGLQSRMK